MLKDIFRPTVSVNFLKTDFHPERIAVAAASLGWPDHDFPLLFSTGAQLLGALPEAHIYRRANVVPSVSLDELLTDANEYVQHIRARPSPKPEQAELVWNKTMEEVELGYMAGSFPAEVVDKLWGEGKWRPIVRFGTEQRDGSFRVIDNGRSGLQNDATGTQERIYTNSDISPVPVSNSVDDRSGQPDETQANETPNIHKKETPIERGNPLYSEIPEWLQEFRENLVDDEIPLQGGSHASSSHEASLEPTTKRRVDLGKHNVHTHFPKDRNCEICKRTKITRAPCRRRKGEAVPRADNFGDSKTEDHKVLSDNCETRNNHRYAVLVQDLATQWIQTYPCKNKISQETQ